MSEPTELHDVTLDTPIVRGEQTITTVKVRKFSSGEMRGCSVSALLNLNYDDIEKLLPRITVPPLTKAEVSTLNPADLVQFGSEIMDFLLPTDAKAGLSQTA
jgi:hypothetical protein